MLNVARFIVFPVIICLIACNNSGAPKDSSSPVMEAYKSSAERTREDFVKICQMKFSELKNYSDDFGLKFNPVFRHADAPDTVLPGANLDEKIIYCNLSDETGYNAGIYVVGDDCKIKIGNCDRLILFATDADGVIYDAKDDITAGD